MIWLYCFSSHGSNMNLIFCDMVNIHCICVLNYFQNLLTTFRVYFRPRVHRLHHETGCTEYIRQADLECCSMFGQPNIVHVWALDEAQYTSSKRLICLVQLFAVCAWHFVSCVVMYFQKLPNTVIMSLAAWYQESVTPKILIETPN
jgi:hypothetical protein